jgi:hypothetical protein
MKLAFLIASALGLSAALSAPAGAACPAVPSWAAGRTTDCKLRVNSGIPDLGTVTFDNEKSYGKSGSLFQPTCGTDSARCNQTFFEWDLDGYNGTKPSGSSCTTSNSCGQGEKGAGSDLSHIWTQIRAKAILWKSVILQNGWKACPGCTSSAANPHVDNLQIWGQFNETFHYLVLQDVLFRNSDDQMLHSSQVQEKGGDIKAVVLQNVVFEQQTAYQTECRARAERYPAMDSGCSGGPLRVPNNGALNSQQWDVWFIKVRSPLSMGGGTCPDSCMTNRVIMIDTPSNVFDRTNYKGTLVTYPSIEAALAAGEKEPPFLRLSCGGWASPPAGCTSTVGPTGNSSGPTNPTEPPPPPPPPPALPAPVQLN